MDDAVDTEAQTTHSSLLNFRYLLSQPSNSIQTAESNISETNEQKYAEKAITLTVYPEQGHFYLRDENILADLGEFIVATVTAISTHVTKAKEDPKKEAEIKQHVISAFRKALDVSQMEIPPNAHFFNELGGTSLDTMILTAHIQASVGLRITQDEFILHPTLNALVKRIMALRRLSMNALTLDPVEAEGGKEWFPASAGQVRMA